MGFNALTQDYVGRVVPGFVYFVKMMQPGNDDVVVVCKAMYVGDRNWVVTVINGKAVSHRLWWAATALVLGRDEDHARRLWNAFFPGGEQ